MLLWVCAAAPGALQNELRGSAEVSALSRRGVFNLATVEIVAAHIGEQTQNATEKNFRKLRNMCLQSLAVIGWERERERERERNKVAELQFAKVMLSEAMRKFVPHFSGGNIVRRSKCLILFLEQFILGKLGRRRQVWNDLDSVGRQCCRCKRFATQPFKMHVWLPLVLFLNF